MLTPPPVPLSMPAILYGTAWKEERTAALVTQALTLGFRGLDTACQPKHYNEAGVGQGIAACLGSKLTREELFLQTKFTSPSGQDPTRIPYDIHAPLAEQVKQSCELSLHNLGTSYLDALILHSPLSTESATFQAWQAMESLVERGLVRALGLSNCYDLALLDSVWQRAVVKPALVQNRFYAKTGYDIALRAFCQAHAMRYQSFWTLSANPQLLSSRLLHSIAKKHEVTREQALFRGVTQLGIVPLTGTSNAAHMSQDLAIFDFALTPTEISALNALLHA